MAKASVEFDASGLLRELRKIAGKAEEVFEETGRRVVEELRGFVGTTEDGRPAHPGGWGDRTGRLASGYDYEVERGANGDVTLTLHNHASHASLLEAKDGYFVLRGADEPGGPIERAFRAAVARHQPEAEVRA